MSCIEVGAAGMTGEEHERGRSADLRASLRAHEDAAADALNAVVGEGALCAVARSGQAFPAAKYREGALSALTEVRRALPPDLSAADTSVVLAVTERWRSRLLRMRDPGPDWVAYLNGGLDALQHLVEPRP